MDKETLSNYGWIVVLVLILAVMLALATPFGTFIAGAIKSTTAGLFSVNQAALGSAGIDVNDMVFENCDHVETEIRNATDTYTGDTCCKACGAVLQAGQTVRAKVPDGGLYTGADGTVYNPGDEMPETVTTGDIYTYEDYEYRYNQSRSFSNWTTNASQNGWGVKVKEYNTNKVTYSEILENINGQPITSLCFTFTSCTNMTSIPEIPDSVTLMNFTFRACQSLKSVSDDLIPNGVTSIKGIFESCSGLLDASNLIIPNTVTDMYSSFAYCYALKKGPQLSNNVTTIDSCFADCKALTEAPAIPSSVEQMGTTFKNCISLVTAPDMSNATNVKSIGWAFYGCTNLSTVPNLSNCTKLTGMNKTFYNCTSLVDLSNLSMPNSVTDLEATFYGCTSLTTAPTISSSANNLRQTFENCSSLVGNIVINTNQIQNISSGATKSGYACFAGVDMTNITLSGASSKTVKNLLGSTGINWTPIS